MVSTAGAVVSLLPNLGKTKHKHMTVEFANGKSTLKQSDGNGISTFEAYQDSLVFSKLP